MLAQGLHISHSAVGAHKTFCMLGIKPAVRIAEGLKTNWQTCWRRGRQGRTCSQRATGDGAGSTLLGKKTREEHH